MEGKQVTRVERGTLILEDVPKITQDLSDLLFPYQNVRYSFMVF